MRGKKGQALHVTKGIEKQVGKKRREKMEVICEVLVSFCIFNTVVGAFSEVLIVTHI